MKGVYSSPDALIGRYSQQTVFPDTIYGLDSGGDPAVIPDLTYQQFQRFYQRHYHPSNSYLFFYGDDHSDERLRLLDAYLAEYEPIDPAPPVALQPRFDATQRFVYGYDAGADEGANGAGAKRSYVDHQLAAERGHRPGHHPGAGRALAHPGQHPGLAAAQSAARFRAGRGSDRRRLRLQLPPGHLQHRLEEHRDRG